MRYPPLGNDVKMVCSGLFPPFVTHHAFESISLTACNASSRDREIVSYQYISIGDTPYHQIQKLDQVRGSIKFCRQYPLRLE